MRAGFTDEPLNGIAARWTASSVNGIAINALLPKLSLRLACRITRTKIAVNTSSITNAEPSPTPAPGFVAVEATSSWFVTISKTSDARMPPRNCEIQ